jgi:hypothetical protein
MPVNHDRLSGTAARIGALLLVAMLLAGCATARNELGPTTGACFRALPVAAAAVHHDGHFAGVRLVDTRDFLRALERLERLEHEPRLVVPRSLAEAPRTLVCIVAFTGHFRPEVIRRRVEPQHGPVRLAIAVVTLTNRVLLATVLLDRAPLRLTRLLPDLG